MICEKATAIILSLVMSAPGYEDGKVDMCFEELAHCKKFEVAVIHKMMEVDEADIVKYWSSRCRPKPRVKAERKD